MIHSEMPVTVEIKWIMNWGEGEGVCSHKVTACTL